MGVVLKNSTTLEQDMKTNAYELNQAALGVSA
jgi:hypothetical protein